MIGFTMTCDQIAIPIDRSKAAPAALKPPLILMTFIQFLPIAFWGGSYNLDPA
jgi:hypothetical protein